MDIENIKKRVQYIRDIRGDDEAAHSAEDELYCDFVRFVAFYGHQSDNPELLSLAKMAYEVLITKKIQFSRWCA